MLSAPPSAGPAFLRVDFVLTSDPARFSVSSKFSNRLNDIYKELPKADRSYDPDSRQWRFVWSRYKELMERLAQVPGVSVGALPVTVVEQYISGRGGPPTAVAHAAQSFEPPSKRLPLALWSSLLPFQRQGVEYAVSRNGRVLFADEMGLGKSIQAIAVAVYYRHTWPLLIIAPKSVVSSWRNELLKWVPDMNEDDVCVPRKGTDTVDGTVRILSYDLVTNFVEKSVITPSSHGFVIADESHSLKSYTAKRTKAIVPLLKSAKHALCLSGTPALSRPAELYTQITALAPTIFGTFKQFSARYCGGHDSKFGGWQARGSTNGEELKALLERTIMIRRFKNDVLSSLPPKRRFAVKVGVKDAKTIEKLRKAKEQLDRIDASLKNIFDAEERSIQEMKRKALVAQLYRDTGVGKVDAVGEFLAKFLQPPTNDFTRVTATSSVGTRSTASSVAASTSASASTKPTRRSTVIIDSDEDDQGDDPEPVIPPAPYVASHAIRKRAFVVEDSDCDEDGVEVGDSDEDGATTSRGRKKTTTDATKPHCIQCNAVLTAPTATNLCDECDTTAFASALCSVASAGSVTTPTVAASSACATAAEPSDAADVMLLDASVDSVDGLPVGMARANKVILFGHHRDVLDGVEAFVRSRGYQCVRIDGGTSARQQQAYVHRFQNDPDCQIAIVGITAAGTGITLTAASACVFVELYWNPGTLNQAEDRIHRIGQQASHVQMVYLLSSEGIDDDIWRIVGRKIDVLTGSLEAQRSGFSTCIGTGGATRGRPQSVLSMMGGTSAPKPGTVPVSTVLPSAVSVAKPPAVETIDIADDDDDMMCFAALEQFEASRK